MANPLFDNFSKQTNPFAKLIQDAQNLKNTFKGNPRDEVQKLLNSGQMSQKQFNQYSQIAQHVMQAIGIK